MKPNNIRSTPYREQALKRLSNRRYALAFLNSALNEQDLDLFIMALKDVVKVHTLDQSYQNPRSGREALYKSFFKEKNPRIGTILNVVYDLGFMLRLSPKKKPQGWHKYIRK